MESDEEIGMGKDKEKEVEVEVEAKAKLDPEWKIRICDELRRFFKMIFLRLYSIASTFYFNI